MAQGGMGIDLKIHNGTALESVVSLLDVEFPKFKKFIAEITGHDSVGGWYEAVDTGKRRLEPFKAVLGWNATSHAGIITAFTNQAAVACSIEDPDGDEVIAFDVHIEEIQRMGAQEDAMKAEVLLHPTGDPTIS
jgi:predicted secreted protein